MHAAAYGATCCRLSESSWACHAAQACLGSCISFVCAAQSPCTAIVTAVTGQAISDIYVCCCCCLCAAAAAGKLFHSGLPHKSINPLELLMDAVLEIQKRFYRDFPAHPLEAK